MDRKASFRNRRGLRLVGIIRGLRPNADLPVVIFAHGLHSSKESPRNTEIAQGLVEAGLAAFLVDLTGHGESEGREGDVTVEVLAGDVSSAVDFLGSAEGIDPARVGVCGSSLGGTAALAAAAGDPRIKALVLRSAPVEGYYALGEKITIPTLIVQGEADPILAESRELFRHLRGERRLELISGAGHLYERPEELRQAREAIVGWFRRWLGDPEEALQDELEAQASKRPKYEARYKHGGAGRVRKTTGGRG